MSTVVNEERAGEHEAVILGTLGPVERLLSLSKGGYLEEHPGHAAVFNANVCLGPDKVWWGDIDLTDEEDRLVTLAVATGETVTLLYERDGRFRNEDEPLIENAVYSVTPSGHTRLEHRIFERRADGLIYQRPILKPPTSPW